MYALAPDEKTTLVMAYTLSMLVRGEVVTKQGVRVSTWLRTDAAPEYVHLVRAQVINFCGSQVKPLNAPEMFLPTEQIVGFHIVPPTQDTIDYDESEKNRIWEPITVLLGAFVIKAKARISAQTGFGVSLVTSRVEWMSLYDAYISSPVLSQMGVLHVPLLIVRPNQVSFVVEEK
ncbi:MAG: hypothetical protein ABWK53_10125 [Anaerolineales bacterium]